jgi:hypothetical protein
MLMSAFLYVPRKISKRNPISSNVLENENRLLDKTLSETARNENSHTYSSNCGDAAFLRGLNISCEGGRCKCVCSDSSVKFQNITKVRET